MKQIVTRGIVLARTNFGEADRILTILTPDFGKIRAIAKGVRKVKSKLAGGIELLSVSHISFIRSKSEINTLTSTRLDKHYGHIVGDLNRTMAAYEALKTIDRATEDNAEADYFYLLQTSLEALDNLNIELGAIQFWLNLQLLKLAGHEPNLQTDTNEEKLAADMTYNFDIEKMALTPNSKGQYHQQHIKLLRLGLGLNSPQPLAKINDINSVLPGVLQLSKTMLKQFD